MLKECKDWQEAGLCRDTRDTATYGMPFAYIENVARSYSETANGLCSFPNRKLLNYPVIAPMLSDAKNSADVDIMNVDLYGINANSQNKEIAWQFLQYLLSPDVQALLAPNAGKESSEIYLDGLAINREAFRQQVEANLKEIQEDEPDLKVYNDKEKYIAEAEAKIDSVDKMIIERSYYRELIYEVAKEYFLDKITAEEAAQRMVDKVGLYLKEQG